MFNFHQWLQFLKKLKILYKKLLIILNLKLNCKQLLIKDPAKRLGANGADEIKNHPWFGTMSWSLLGEKKVRP